MKLKIKMSLILELLVNNQQNNLVYKNKNYVNVLHVEEEELIKILFSKLIKYYKEAKIKTNTNQMIKLIKKYNNV